jgi:hypothetical protein
MVFDPNNYPTQYREHSPAKAGSRNRGLNKWLSEMQPGFAIDVPYGDLNIASVRTAISKVNAVRRPFGVKIYMTADKYRGIVTIGAIKLPINPVGIED